MVTIYPLTPFSRYTCCNTVLTRSVAAVFLSANIIRVFATSNGVVVAAAKAPARAPQFATSHDSKGMLFLKCILYVDLRYSRIGN
jgi:hypothetical protein